MPGPTVYKLASPGPHGRDDGGGQGHLAHGKNGDIGDAGVNQFDCAHRPRNLPRVDIHQHDLGALLFDLPQHGIARSMRKSRVAQHRARQVGAFHARVQDDGLLAILGEDGDGYALHESVLGVQRHATSFLPSGPSDHRNENSLMGNGQNRLHGSGI